MKRPTVSGIGTTFTTALVERVRLAAIARLAERAALSPLPRPAQGGVAPVVPVSGARALQPKAPQGDA